MSSAATIIAERNDWLGDMRGDERVIEELRRNAGMVFRYPSADVVERWIRERQICQSLTVDPRTENVRRLSTLSGMDVRKTAKVLKRKTGVGVAAHRTRTNGCLAPRGLSRHPRHRVIVV